MTTHIPALRVAYLIGMRRVLSQPLVLFGTALFLVVLSISYTGVLKALPLADLARLKLTEAQLMWYLILIQAAVIGISSEFRGFQQPLRDGSIEVLLTRPSPYWIISLAEGMGAQTARVTCLMPLTCITGLSLAGHIQWSDASLLIVPACFATALLTLASLMIVASSALWISDAGPVFWIYQKLIFVFGGLLWPLVFYPAWLQDIAWKTPFPAMIGVIGNFALETRPAPLLDFLGQQCLWIVFALVLCTVMARAVRRRTSR